MIQKIITAAVFSISLLLGCGSKPEGIRLPGLQPDGSVLLMNGRHLTPVGAQIPVGEFPLGIVLSPDNRYAVVTNTGHKEHSITVIDIQSRQEVQRFPMESAFLGICFSPDGGLLYASGGGSNSIEVLSFRSGVVQHESSLSLSRWDENKTFFPAGIAVSKDGQLLVCANLFDNSIAVFDLGGNTAPKVIPVGEFPYAVVLHPDKPLAYISNRGDQSISVVDMNSFREITKIPVGSQPSALVLSPDGNRLYAANAGSDNVSIIDTESSRVEETVDLLPFSGAPAGTQPNALAITSDGKTLFTANAGNNSIAVVDVSPSPAHVRGFLPTGWNPTAVLLTSDNEQLLVSNGGGQGHRFSPHDPSQIQNNIPGSPQLFGTVSIIDLPEESQLSDYTAQVYSNNGFEKMKEALEYGNSFISPRAVPRKLGEASLIQYVFYIIKGNLSFDHVFGDLSKNEPESSAALFDSAVTPNHHSLAEEFVLFDNFYAAGETETEGIDWSLAANVSGFTVKLSPLYSSVRTILSPGRDSFFLIPPASGYLWDAAIKNRISFRSYGVFANNDQGKRFSPPSTVKNVQEHSAPGYSSYDNTISDLERAAAFIAEFNNFIAGDSLPQLNIIRLANDYLQPDSPENLQSRNLVADNDRALGLIVEAISHSPVWRESAIFVIETSRANESDTIDSHKTVALVISPYVKRGITDHTLYDTASIVHTIELIFGMLPLSQYTAAALPLYSCFQDAADLKPYIAR